MPLSKAFLLFSCFISAMSKECWETEGRGKHFLSFRPWTERVLAVKPLKNLETDRAGVLSRAIHYSLGRKALPTLKIWVLRISYLCSYQSHTNTGPIESYRIYFIKNNLVAPILVDIKIIPLTLTPGCESPPPPPPPYTICIEYVLRIFFTQNIGYSSSYLFGLIKYGLLYPIFLCIFMLRESKC